MAAILVTGEALDANDGWSTDRCTRMVDGGVLTPRQ